MGELQDSAFGSRFEPDAFYESFQAPKFHDFTAPEEPIDPDAFFMAQPEMVTKKAIPMKNVNITAPKVVAMKDVKIMAPKIHKVTVQGAPKTAQGSLEQVPPKAPVAAEKAVWSSKNPCSSLLPLVMSNLRLLGSLSPLCTCWSPGLLREF